MRMRNLFFLLGAGLIVFGGVMLFRNTHQSSYAKGLAPWDLSAIAAQIGMSESSYHVAKAGKMYGAANPGQHYQVAFSAQGPVFTYHQSTFSFGLQNASYGSPLISGNRISYDRGNFREWYINGPYGLEQGFTFNRNLVPGSPLGLTLSLRGISAVQLHDAGHGITFTTANGKRLEYQGLSAYDANHKELPVQFAFVSIGTVLITVDDSGAKYPITVDPYVQEQKLSASDGSPGAVDEFGVSVGITSDSSRVVIGATSAIVDGVDFQGAAYVFVRSGITWTQEQKLVASDGQTLDQFGNCVSIDSDGTRIAVGALGVNNLHGQVYIFKRSGTTWTQEQILTASDAADSDAFGDAIALDSTATRVIVGAGNKADGGAVQQGAAYVFTRSGTTWTQEQKLLSSDGAVVDIFGRSVDITADGSRLIIGAANAHNADGGKGQAYIFSRSGTTWTEEKILTASDAANGDLFGTTTRISDDGTRAVVSAASATVGGNVAQGAVYVFLRSGTNWAQEQKFSSADGQAGDVFGFGLDINPNGTLIAAGAIEANSTQGVVYTFTRSGTIWTQNERFVDSAPTNGDNFGYAIALDADGTRLVAGLPVEDNQDREGFANIFTVSSGVTPGRSARHPENFPPPAMSTPTAPPTPAPTPLLPPSQSPTPSLTPTSTPTLSPSPAIEASPSPTRTPTPVPTVAAVVSVEPSSEVLPPPAPASAPEIPSAGGGVVNAITTVLSDAVKVISEPTLQIANAINDVCGKDAVQAASCATAAAGTTAAVAGLAAAAAQNEVVASSHWVMQIVGLRRKTRVWGVVYDSATKRPIPFAKVLLFDEGGRLLETRFADRDGRYGFLASPQSMHQEILTVSIRIQKPGYQFPSQTVTGDTDYIVYDRIYHGEPLRISRETAFNFNIPADPTSHARPTWSGMGLSLIGTVGDRLLNLCFYIGLFAVPWSYYQVRSTPNLLILIAFLGANLFRMLAVYRPYGTIVDAHTGKPVAFALITLNDAQGQRVAFTVSDEYGRFILSGPRGAAYDVIAYTPANVHPGRAVTFHLSKLRRGWVTTEMNI